MDWLSKETKRLLFEMSVGIVLYNLLLIILASLLMPRMGEPLIPVMLGLLAGMAGAIAMLVHMAVTTEQALESRSENYANKNTVVQAMIRKLVYLAALLALWRVADLNLLAIVIGTMGMKAGAYLQPWVHKFFERHSKQS